MSVLEVMYGDVIEDGKKLPRMWKVSIPRRELAVLYGFARKRDAEIAKEFLDGLEVDWLGNRSEAWRQLKAAGYPTRDDLMKAACERLQW